MKLGLEKRVVHGAVGELVVGEVGVRGAHPDAAIATLPRRVRLKHRRDRLELLNQSS